MGSGVRSDASTTTGTGPGRAGGIGIVGIGAVTGYGWGVDALWDGLLSGVSAATTHPGFMPRPGDPGWVAHVPDGGDPADGRSIFARAMRASVREAVADATARGWKRGRRVGLLHAVVLGDVEVWRRFYLQDDRDLTVREYLALMPSTPISTCMQEFGFHGPALNVSAMCASGNTGLIIAKSWLDTGIVDDVVLVATDISLTPENVEHFVRLGVAVTDEEPLLASRPFQTGSRGFVMGEASAAYVLSGQTGPAYTRMLGGAMSHDAYHVTSVDPGLGAVRDCFTEAFAAAGVRSQDVHYLNAHGPGTQQCDTAEATMLEELLAPDAEVFSVKPLTGHCQGAASAVEIAASALGYHHGVIPAPPAVSEAHPQLLAGPSKLEPELTAKSSLGMGGHNAVVILAPPE